MGRGVLGSREGKFGGGPVHREGPGRVQGGIWRGAGAPGEFEGGSPKFGDDGMGPKGSRCTGKNLEGAREGVPKTGECLEGVPGSPERTGGGAWGDSGGSQGWQRGGPQNQGVPGRRQKRVPKSRGRHGGVPKTHDWFRGVPVYRKEPGGYQSGGLPKTVVRHTGVPKIPGCPGGFPVLLPPREGPEGEPRFTGGRPHPFPHPHLCRISLRILRQPQNPANAPQTPPPQRPLGDRSPLPEDTGGHRGGGNSRFSRRCRAGPRRYR